MRTTLNLAAFSAVALVGAVTNAAVIAEYTFEDGTGAPVTEAAGTNATALAGSGVSGGWVASFGTLSSQKAVFQNNVGDAPPATSNSATTNLNTANGDYFTFTITADAGKTFSISSITMQGARNAGSSAPNFGLWTSAIGFSTGTPVISGSWGSGASIWNNAASADLSSNASYQGLTSVEMRITTYNGTFGTGNRDAFFDNIIINGTVVPEPASLGLVSAAGLLAIRRRRMA